MRERPNGSSRAAEPCDAFSRIIAVADALDAMLMPRPYRQGRTIEEALVEIESCAGTQFDPNIVTVFTTMVRAVQAAHFTSPILATCRTIT